MNNQLKIAVGQLSVLVKRDLTHTVLSFKPLLIFLLAQVIDLYLFVLMYSRLIGQDYFYFASAGILSMYIYVNSSRTGDDHNRERIRGFDVYLAYLPVSRGTLLLGKLLAGMIAGSAYNLFFLVTLILFTGITVPVLHLVVIIIASSLLALFAASFSLVLAELIRIPRHYSQISSFIYSYFLFFSTVFYPVDVFPVQALSFIVEFNPVSSCASIIRENLTSEPGTILIEPFSVLAGFAIVITIALLLITGKLAKNYRFRV